jgi:hypothetical protein
VRGIGEVIDERHRGGRDVDATFHLRVWVVRKSTSWSLCLTTLCTCPTANVAIGVAASRSPPARLTRNSDEPIAGLPNELRVCTSSTT